jgi:hypothetical protein
MMTWQALHVRPCLERDQLATSVGVPHDDRLVARRGGQPRRRNNDNKSSTEIVSRLTFGVNAYYLYSDARRSNFVRVLVDNDPI